MTFLDRVTDTLSTQELNDLVREAVPMFNKARDAAGLGEFQSAVVKHREFLRGVAEKEKAGA